MFQNSKRIVFCFLPFLLVASSLAQQVSDTVYTPPYFKPLYEEGKGPTVFIDAAHHNFHTVDGRYAPFAKLLRKDGFTVKSWDNNFSLEALKGIKIIVIANALHEANTNNWDLPNLSAFTKEEIKVLNQWVSEGGSLFLIADHMPFAGAAADLASSFGFTIYNGFVRDTLNKRNGDVFTKNNGLQTHKITAETDTIVTFTGQAFDLPKNSVSLISLDKRFTIFLPARAWVFNDSTLKIPGAGKSQLAISEFGEGRVVISGEAAMFTAQLSNGTKMGMNSPRAKQNYLLLINTIRWLNKTN